MFPCPATFHCEQSWGVVWQSLAHNRTHFNNTAMLTIISALVCYVAILQWVYKISVPFFSIQLTRKSQPWCWENVTALTYSTASDIMQSYWHKSFHKGLWEGILMTFPFMLDSPVYSLLKEYPPLDYHKDTSRSFHLVTFLTKRRSSFLEDPLSHPLVDYAVG